jgi:hypothetical protein
MAAQEKDEDVKNKPETRQANSIAVRLVQDAPAGQPLLANYSSASVTSGLVMLDLGFLEPAMLAELSRVARSGGKVPKTVSGRLAARVALTPDAARSLHQQLSRLLSPAKTKDKVLN